MPNRSAYKTTTVPVSRSQEAIRKLLVKYGVIGCQFTENFETGDVTLRFVKEIEETPRTVRISLTTESNEKQAYRALYYWMKSQLEAVDFGLLSFEHVFLAHFEWLLESGEATTIGQMVIPELSKQTPGRLLIGVARQDEGSMEADWREV